MCVRVYVCYIYIYNGCIYVHLYTHGYVYAYGMYMCIYIYIYVFSVYRGIYIYIFICMYACRYVCTYVFIYICIYTHPKRKFPTAWIFDTSADAKQFRSKVPTAAKRLIPLNAMSQNARKVTERFDIVNDSGFAPKATDLRKRRFRARISPLTFKRVKQSGLFATDVATRASVKHYIEIESCAKYVAS